MAEEDVADVTAAFAGFGLNGAPADAAGPGAPADESNPGTARPQARRAVARGRGRVRPRPQTTGAGAGAGAGARPASKAPASKAPARKAPGAVNKVECSVCMLNRSEKSTVVCGSCGEGACVACTKAHLLGLSGSPKCFNCDALWGGKFLFDSPLPKTWLQGCQEGQLRAKQKKQWVTEEKGRLAETQAQLAYEEDLRSKISQLRKEREPMAERVRVAERAYHEASKALSQARDEARVVTQAISGYAESLARSMNNGGETIHGREFICGCPVPECRGLVPSSGRCTVCASMVCDSCHEVIWTPPSTGTESGAGAGADGADAAADVASHVASHVCDPAIVANLRAVAEEARPCPRCAAPISKVSGCDDMWCTRCRLTFSWNTGMEVLGNRHNPHRAAVEAEERRHARREPLDVPCGGVPTNFGSISRGDTRGDIVAIIRLLESLGPRIARASLPADCAALRRDWVTKKITDAEFEQGVFLARRKVQNAAASIDALMTFRTLVVERIRNSSETLSEKERTLTRTEMFARGPKSWFDGPDGPIAERARLLAVLHKIRRRTNKYITEACQEAGFLRGSPTITEQWRLKR
jgi:hypothetical protein